MALSKRLRYEVLRRDNHTCRYCGGVAPDVKLTVDHVLPTALGGSDLADNLVAACADCNAGKSSATPDQAMVAQVNEDALAWAAANREAAAIRATERELKQAYIDAAILAGSGRFYKLPSSAVSTFGSLYDAGLSIAELTECMDIAAGAFGIHTSRFAYFCGVAWKRIQAQQDIAKALYDRQRAQGVQE